MHERRPMIFRRSCSLLAVLLCACSAGRHAAPPISAMDQAPRRDVEVLVTGSAPDSRASRPADARVLARVGDREIGADSVVSEMRRTSPRLLGAFLRKLTVQELIRRESADMGLSVP